MYSIESGIKILPYVDHICLDTLHTHTHTPVPLPKFTVYCICTVWLLLFCLIYTQKKTQWSICENVYYSSSFWLYLTIFTSIVHTGQGSCVPFGSCQKCSEYCTWSPSKKSVVWNLCVPFALSHNQWLVQCSAVHPTSIHICWTCV